MEKSIFRLNWIQDLSHACRNSIQSLGKEPACGVAGIIFSDPVGGKSGQTEHLKPEETFYIKPNLSILLIPVKHRFIP
jgi:hypothetical protein